MCFSATASFSAGIAITAIGIVTLKKAHQPRAYLFASIPLLFGIQQITEGFVWLSFMNPAYLAWQKAASILFIVFAQAIWPLLGPLSMLLIEKNKKRRKLLRLLTGLGFSISAYRLIWLCFFNVHATLAGHHINYLFDSEAAFSPLVPAIYFISTVLPPFVSGVKKMWAIGLAVISSFLFTRLFYGEYLVSVWCFSAALISAIVFLIVFDLKKSFLEGTS